MTNLDDLAGLFTFQTITRGSKSTDPITRRRNTAVNKLMSAYEKAKTGVEDKKFNFVVKQGDGSFRVRLFVNNKPLETWKAGFHVVPADKIEAYVERVAAKLKDGSFDKELEEAEERFKAGRIKRT